MDWLQRLHCEQHMKRPLQSRWYGLKSLGLEAANWQSNLCPATCWPCGFGEMIWPLWASESSLVRQMGQQSLPCDTDGRTEYKYLAQCCTSTAHSGRALLPPCHMNDHPLVFPLSRKLKEKRPSGPQRTHPNFFWPGHLLDKLQLYLPTMTVDRSLALFSCVRRTPQAYSVAYHPNHWWPIKAMNYMTCAYYDAPEIYHIN